MATGDITAAPGKWEAMTGIQSGSDTRNVRESSGTQCIMYLDDPLTGQPNPVTPDTLKFDHIDLTEPEATASAYSTTLLSSVEYETMAVGRLKAGGQISANIECSAKTYAKLTNRISRTGVAVIIIPSQRRFSQYRVALLGIGAPTHANGDRVTSTLTIAVTNSSADGEYEIGPVFGAVTFAPGLPETVNNVATLVADSPRL